jgi:hypothetical protein
MGLTRIQSGNQLSSKQDRYFQHKEISEERRISTKYNLPYLSIFRSPALVELAISGNSASRNCAPRKITARNGTLS